MSTASRRRRKRRRTVVEALEGRALLAVAGSLDPTFGGGYGSSNNSIGLPDVSYTTGFGYLTTSTSTDATINQVAALPDGGVVVAATGVIESTFDADSAASVGGAELVVKELNADGSLNTSFGTGGQVQIPVATVQEGANSGFISVVGEHYKLAVDSQGRIILAAATTDDGGNPTYIAARLDANGTLDTTFGTGGFASYPATTTTLAAGRMDNIASVLIQSDGQIVLAGNSADGFSAVRLNIDGSLDTTYGQEGTATVSTAAIGQPETVVSGAALQSDGDVVLVGTMTTETGEVGETHAVDSEVGVTRLTTTGVLDTTFGGSEAAGLLVIPAVITNNTPEDFNSASVVVLEPSTGQILVAGYNSYSGSSELYRLDTDGTLDPSFGSGGLLDVDVPGADYGLGLAVQADGSIVLSAVAESRNGYEEGYTFTKLEVLRLDAAGAPDATFGTTSIPGLVTTDLTSDAPAGSLAIDPADGDILLAGVGTVGSTSGMTFSVDVEALVPAATAGAARASEPLPVADFDGAGYSDFAVYSPQSTDANLAGTGQFVGSSYYADSFGSGGVGQSIPAAADYLGLGYDQAAVYLPALGVYAIDTSPGSTPTTVTIGTPGNGQSIPVPADYFGTGQADVAVYVPSTGTFEIANPSNKSSIIDLQYGIPGVGQSIPAPADYFGTGQADIAVYLAQSGQFAIVDPANGQQYIFGYGDPGLGQTIPTPGDYDGAGHAEVAVYLPSAGAFFYTSKTGQQVVVPVGTANSGEIPVPGDYDGSGVTEAAVYNQAGGFIVYQPAKGGPEVTVYVGTPNDGSLPAAGPVGAYPGFGDYLSATASTSAIRSAVVVSSPSPSVQAASVTASTTVAVAVPSGPMAAMVRVTRSLVNQAAPDPLGSD